MKIERKPIEFDETNIIKDTIKSLADDEHLLSTIIGNYIDYYELCDCLQESELEHVTDLLVEKVTTLLLNFADEITKEKLEKGNNV